MRVSRSVCLMFVSLSMFIFSTSAAAQQAYVAPTDGILLPSPSITEVNDATAIATNPANIGFMDAWSFVYAGGWLQNKSHLPGQGHGFFLAIPIGPFGIGMATELLLPHESIRQWQGLDKRGRFSLAMSLNPSKGLGIGVAYRRFFRYDFGDTLRSVDLSVAIRPMNHLNFSFLFSDLNTPNVTYGSTKFSGFTLPSRTEEAPKRFVAGMTIRPFGDDRIAVGTELHYMHGTRRLFDQMNWDYVNASFQRTDIHGVVSVMLTDGISLRTRFVAQGLRSSEFDNAYYLDTSLSIDAARFPFGVTASPYFKLHPESNNGFEAMSLAIRLSGATPASIPLMLAPQYIVSLDIEKIGDSYNAAELMAKLERIKFDRSVDMLLIKPKARSVTISQALEIRREVKAIVATGKKVVCYVEEADAASYLTCSAASQIWVNPAGGIRMAGISTQAVYFKDLLDKLGVKADIIRIGEYKSAPEAFTKTGPTQAAAEAMNRYMDSVYGELLSAVQKDRGFSDVAKAKKAVESGPFMASEAISKKLADKIVAADMVESELENLFDSPIYIEEKYGSKPLERRTYLDSPAVAVLHVQGDIVTGESRHIPLLGVHQTGAKTLTEEIRKLKDDNRIKAVLVRINSPGGSALASDIIWRELMILRETKPVVASLGTVAASGAYYIASAANLIFSESTTLTGSIGIYYGKADISGLLDKVGISTTPYVRGEHADIQSWTRPYTAEEREKLAGQLKKYYKLFLNRVSTGRDNGMTTVAVDKRGQGRIWSGVDAKHHQLVDRIGGYQQALDYARGLAHISKGTRVFHFPRPNFGFMKMMAKRMEAKSQVENWFALARETKETLKAVVPFTMSNHAVPQARLPFAVIQMP